MGKWLVWVFVIVLLVSFVLAENVVLSTYLDEEVYLGQEYTKLFKIKIENQEGCSSKKDLITVYYNITNSELVKEDFFEREVGCSGTANTGEFIPSEPGDYVLCGELINTSTAGNENLDDDEACTNFTVLDTSNILCDIILNITTNETFIYEKGESIKFKTELNEKTFPFEIEYWIEDLFGSFYKNPYVSTNTNQKSWKTNIDEEDRILLIKARVNASCNDTNLTNNYAEKMFVVTNSLDEEGESSEGEEENSSIEVISVAPDPSEFGDIIKAKINVYRGSTGKYAVYAYVEKGGKKVSEKVTMHFKDKFTDYTLMVPIQLKPNCNKGIKDGKVDLIIEGLGERAEKKVTVSGIDEKFCGSGSKGSSNEKEKLSYQIADLPMSILAGENLEVVVELTGDSKEHNYKAWSYLYRGSKCYSCEEGEERDNNLIEFELDENEEKKIKLPVKVNQEIEEGEYKLKVKLNKDGQKTNKELTESIYVKEAVKEPELKEETNSLCLSSSGSELVNEDLISNKMAINGITGSVVYESSSEKANKLIPHVIIAVLGLLCLVLLFRKT